MSILGRKLAGENIRDVVAIETDDDTKGEWLLLAQIRGLYNVTNSAVTQARDDGRIKSKHERGAYHYEAKSVESAFSERRKIQAPYVDDPEPVKRLMLVGTDLAPSLNESNLLLKQEEARRRQYANEVIEGRLVERDAVNAGLDDGFSRLFPAFLSAMENLVETWGMRLLLSPASQESMRRDFHAKITTTWAEIRADVEKAWAFEATKK